MGGSVGSTTGTGSGGGEGGAADASGVGALDWFVLTPSGGMVAGAKPQAAGSCALAASAPEVGAGTSAGGALSVGEGTGTGAGDTIAEVSTAGAWRRFSKSAIISETSSSVSRQAVPLPMAITEISCLRISVSRMTLD